MRTIRAETLFILLVLISSGLIAYALAPQSARAAAGNDSNAVFLMHADGGLSTTAFFDDSVYGATLTANGNAKVSTSTYKFGGGAYIGDGSGDYVSAPDNARYEFGTGDFTLDLWVNPSDTGGNKGVLGKGAGAGYSPWLIYVTGSTFYFYSSSAGASWDICNAVSMGAFSAGTWYHLAVVRNGNTFTVYKDGTSQNTCTSASSLWDNTGTVFIGDQSGGNSFNGYIDEVRLSNIARWTSNFTPPTRAYSGGITISVNATAVGNVTVVGALAKGRGTFVIDHPLDPKNKLLYHSFVESPDVKNLYDGVTKLDAWGEGEIVLPDYFLALNKDVRYLAQGVSAAMPDLHLKKGVHRRWMFGKPVFSVSGGIPGGEISWQVTGTRRDPLILKNPIIPEVFKTGSTVVPLGECLFDPLCK